MASKNKGPTGKTKTDKINRLLQGDDDVDLIEGNALRKLFVATVRSFRTTPGSWSRGLDKLIKHKESIGELTGNQGTFKRSNLSDSFSKSEVSWKSFLDGLMLMLFIAKNRICSIKFQVVIVRKINKNDKETIVHSITVHDQEVD